MTANLPDKEPILPGKTTTTPEQSGYGSLSSKEKEQTESNNGDGNNGEEELGAFGQIMEVWHERRESLVEGFDAVFETVFEEANDFRDNFLEELHHADEGDVYFLDTQLARNVSVLPNDIQTFGEDATRKAEEAFEQEMEEKMSIIDEEELKDLEMPEFSDLKPPFTAYLLLFSAVLSLSSIAPLLKAQGGVDSAMKIVWRQSATCVMLCPLAIRSIVKDGVPTLTNTQWTMFWIMALSYAASVLTFSLALDYTSVGNVVILGNAQSMILLAGKICTGNPVTILEGMGAMTAFLGTVLCSKDSSEGSTHTKRGMTFVGDLIALMAAITMTIYMVLAKPLRPHIDLFVFMTLNMLMGSLLNFAFVAFVLGRPVSLDLNDNHGYFGWMNLEFDRLPIEILMALICNVFGALGYIRAMQWFDNIVISVAALMEPVVAELIACAIGVGELPGLQGWVGNLLVILGTLAVCGVSNNSHG